MTQHGQATFPAARVILVIAGIAAAFAIGFAVSNGQLPEQSAPSEIPAENSKSLADLEQATRDDPANGAAWQKLGAAYFAGEKFSDAAQAYARAAAIDPSDAIVWSALGEAQVMASERDPMPMEAVAAFEKAIALDPEDPRARYFLAVKRDLGGDHDGAIADWLALLEDTPTDAPWRTDLIRTIQQVGKINMIDVSKRLADAGAASPQAPVAMQAIPGPSAQDLAAASRIPPGEQRQMAEGMVERLENRLKSDPANTEGWVMLIRSRMTLDQPAKAKKALDAAVKANPAKADFLRQQAATLGVN